MSLLNNYLTKKTPIQQSEYFKRCFNFFHNFFSLEKSIVLKISACLKILFFYFYFFVEPAVQGHGSDKTW